MNNKDLENYQTFRNLITNELNQLLFLETTEKQKEKDIKIQ